VVIMQLINQALANIIVKNYLKPVRQTTDNIITYSLKETNNVRQAFCYTVYCNDQVIGEVWINYWYGDVNKFLSTPLHVLREKCK
jgi:hypothetical protein